MSGTYAPEPCPGCPEVRLDCACVVSLEGMALADIKVIDARVAARLGEVTANG